MKLLIITQKIDENDDVLGFFHRWLQEFSRQFERITAVCLQQGQYHLPNNVKVFSLGKEKKPAKWRYVYNFYSHIIRERHQYDTVWVHMNQIYVLLGWPVWRLLGKKVTLWYAHGHTPFTLRIAALLCHTIFTSTTSGCRLRSKKIRIVGQGIDTAYFLPVPKKEQEKFTIISIGRLSPIKNYETLIGSLLYLQPSTLKKIHVQILGGASGALGANYETQLKQQVQEKKLTGVVQFLGAVSYTHILSYLQSADLFVNTSHTGSLDKAILEAMATELPILTCNEAVLGVLGEYEAKLLYPKSNAKALAEKIEWLMDLSPTERQHVGKDLRTIVKNQHSVENLIGKIKKELL